MSNDNLLEMDECQLYFGEDFVVNSNIKLHQPKIGEIIQYGEREYYSMVSTVSAIPSELKSRLWDSGVDWTQITNFQLAMMLWPTLPKEKTQIIFGDLDFQKFSPRSNMQNDEICLVDIDNGIVIDELAYGRIQSYLCSVHNLSKKVEKAANSYTKKILIDEDRQKIINSNKQPYKSFLFPLITAIKARQKYSTDYMRNMGIYELTIEASRLQIILNADALLQGSYSGMMDTSKINKSAYDWMRPIETNNKTSAMSLK